MSNIYKGKHVLVLEGYCKQALPYLREFKNLGCEVSVLCGSKLDCSYVSKFPDHKILGICDLKKPEESEKYIIDLIKTGKYDLVFPLFDFSAKILSHHKEELSQYAIIYANDKEIFDAAYDKNNVMKVCMENDIPCPKTIFDVKSIDDINKINLQFPILIKPRSMYGARGVHAFYSIEEMQKYIKDKQINLSDYVVQEYLTDNSRVMGGNVFIDRNGDIKSLYLYICEHLYPEDGGTSTLNAILEREDINRTCEKLVKKMNLRGEIGIDLMIDSKDNVAKVIEINVRSVHAIAIGFINGVNHAQQVLEDAFGMEVTPMAINRTDTCLRILQTDILWFLSSSDRLKKTPKKLGYKHTKEQMFYWDDPLPWFAFLIGGIKDFKKKMKEKRQ